MAGIATYLPHSSFRQRNQYIDDFLWYTDDDDDDDNFKSFIYMM